MIMLDSKADGAAPSGSFNRNDASPSSEIPQEIIEEEVKVEDIPF